MTANDGFTAIVLVGPAETEIDRLRDLTAALLHYEPGYRRLILVDDSPDAPRDFSSQLPGVPRLEVIASERHARGNPVMGGGCTNMLTGLRAAAADVGEFVLKIDTDALIVGPFVERLRHMIAREPLCGIIGACRLSPDGGERTTVHHRRVLENIASWRIKAGQRRSTGRRRAIPTSLRELKLMLLVRRAGRRIGELGVNVSGGAYAITATAIERMQRAGFLRDVSLWADTTTTEDAVIPMYAAMCGLKLVDYAAPGEVFGISYRGLPATLPEIVDRQYGLIHCVKNDPRATEPEIRQFFAARRQAA